MPPKTTKAPARTSTDRWENEGGPSSASFDGTDAELKKLGITPVQRTVFHWDGYRYSNSRDAIAAAKRAIKADVS